MRSSASEGSASAGAGEGVGLVTGEAEAVLETPAEGVA